ncbi:MAG: molecular chaperone TorD family protein [Verrucomicrobiales bacterium]|nr:molecular chaperone TorD family protein [Verrucomicrobiales bacterium]
MDSDESSAAESPDNGRRQAGADNAAGSETLQAGIHRALARSFVYRYLAKAYEHPTPDNWNWLTESGILATFASSAGLLGEAVKASAGTLTQHLRAAAFDTFLGAYLTSFGHAARGSCPLNEIEYGDIKADPLFQPHRLADLAAFYRAFGLEVTSDAGERHDHLALELEFLCVLAAKDAYALEYQLDAADYDLGREAQRKFLREHLGRWTPAFSRRLAASATDPALRGLAEFTRVFVESDCHDFEVTPGSEELTLRPVDETADRMCDACGLPNLPPGALSGSNE